MLRGIAALPFVPLVALSPFKFSPVRLDLGLAFGLSTSACVEKAYPSFLS